jgi:LmbE family N-acetylglucosaminyl deacetylase
MCSDSARDDPPYGGIETITGNETLLVLVPGPGDESLRCGGLIATCCRRGRPPFVMVLGDGTSYPPTPSRPADHLAARHERETRAAAACLGLPHDRLLMVGLFDGTIPREGPVFDAVVRAVTLVMWARDCNVICAPSRDDDSPAGRATAGVADAVAIGSEVGRLAYVTAERVPAGADAWRLDIAARLPAKRAAIAAHVALRGKAVVDASELACEVLLRCEILA